VLTSSGNNLVFSIKRLHTRVRSQYEYPGEVLSPETQASHVTDRWDYGARVPVCWPAQINIGRHETVPSAALSQSRGVNRPVKYHPNGVGLHHNLC
jgi:hypothetical protein